MKESEARSNLDGEIFHLLRHHAQPIREAIEHAVISAAGDGRHECSVSYDGISLRDCTNPLPRLQDVERNYAVLEIRQWAIAEGLRVEVAIEQAPHGAIGFQAMKYPRFRFDVSWSESDCQEADRKSPG